MPDFTTVYVTGKLYWPKILGNPVANYEGDAKEWTYQLVPDNTDFLEEHDLEDRLKEDKKGIIPGKFLNLKKPELDSKGQPNDPIRVYDSDNKAWDSMVKIGNGSGADVKLTIVDWGRGKKKSIWTAAIRVTDLIPYESDEFGGMNKPVVNPAKPAKKAVKIKDQFREDFGLDDGVEDIGN